MPNLQSTVVVKCLSRLFTEVQTMTESCTGCYLFAVITKHMSLLIYSSKENPLTLCQKTMHC